MDSTLITLSFVVCFTIIITISIKTDENDVDTYRNGFEGDMILTDEQINYVLHSGYRNAEGLAKYRWPNGVVYYEISSVFGKDHVKQIKLAMAEIEKVTCVRFRPKTIFTRDYVSIYNQHEGCSSAVGRKGGKQDLKLTINDIGVGYFKLPTIIHELIHTLGFHHQQSAVGRDNYVRIMWKNIKPGKEHNFKAYSTNDFGVPYDYRSLMHYKSTAFSINGEPTIVPLYKNVIIGDMKKLTDSDIKKINLMYKCP